MAGAVLLGMALLSLWCAASLLAASWACGYLSRGASANELAADILLAAIAIAITLSSTLVVAGAASVVTLSAGFCVLGAAALACDAKASAARLSEVTVAGLRALYRSPTLWLLPAFALCAIARGLALPQLSWDGLTYHLTYPAIWIQHGGATRFEAGGVFEAYESFPKGGETLFYLAMLPFHGDALVNLANLPAWFGLAISLRACARQLGLRNSLADGAAVSLALCPAFAAYVTPAYVEVGSAFAFAAALNAGLRALSGEARALASFGIAVGVAAATKLPGLHLIAFFVLVVLFCARHDARSALRAGSLGTLLAALAAAPFYVRNALVCGNPLYPAPLPGFGAGPRAGSLALRYTLEQTSVLAQGALPGVLEQLLGPPWHGYPLGPALSYPLALALPWLVFAFGTRAQRRTGSVLIALGAAELCIYLVSPWNGIYTGANTRFLGPSLIALGLASALALEATPVRLRRALGLLALACSLAYLARAPVVAQPVACVPAWLTALLLGASLFCASRAAIAPARSDLGFAALFFACALAALPSALAFRERHRLASYANATDLHPLPAPSKQLWALVAGLPASRIAFAVGGIDSTEGWFFYPLFGSDLRHEVRYVDIEADGERACCLRRGEIRDQPDLFAWRKRLAAQGIDYLITHGAPLEERWAQADPERFVRVVSLPESTIFHLTRAGRAGAAQAAPSR